jgi:hypothetical protein
MSRAAKLMASALLAWAGIGSGASAGPPEGVAPRSAAVRPVVRLAWTDPAGITAAGWVRASAETAQVLGELGLEVRSRSAPAHEPLRPGEIRAILVPGPPPRASDGHVVLGAASGSSPNPKMWVHGDGVAVLLGAATPFHAVTAPIGDVIRFDLAVGRVVAHEVVHLLAPELPHGRGLMAACADPREFVQHKMNIDPTLGPLVQTAIRTAAASSRSRGDAALAVFSDPPSAAGP